MDFDITLLGKLYQFINLWRFFREFNADLKDLIRRIFKEFENRIDPPNEITGLWDFFVGIMSGLPGLSSWLPFPHDQTKGKWVKGCL